MSFLTPPSFPGFSTAAYTAAPNNAVNVAAVVAVGGSAAVDLALLPKTVGAIIADIPDNAASGGNKRGQNSVDFQILRSASTQVASGNNSGILSGGNNTAIGQESVVSGGDNNNARSNFTTIGGGSENTAGTAPLKTGATVGGGVQNLADGKNSCIPGGAGASVRTVQGRFAYGSFSNLTQAGQFQFSELVECTSTPDATPKRLVPDGIAGGVAATDNACTVADNSCNSFVTHVAARNNATGDSSVWRIDGVIKRGAGVGTTALVGAPTVTLVAQDAGAAGWAVAATADAVNGALAITATGAAATTIRWVALTKLVEVTF